MDEQKKEYMRYAVIGIGIIAVLVVGWLMFRDIRTDPATDQRVEERMGDVEEQFNES